MGEGFSPPAKAGWRGTMPAVLDVPAETDLCTASSISSAVRGGGDAARKAKGLGDLAASVGENPRAKFLVHPNERVPIQNLSVLVEVTLLASATTTLEQFLSS